jgi:hypothetical protein
VGRENGDRGIGVADVQHPEPPEFDQETNVDDAAIRGRVVRQVEYLRRLTAVSPQSPATACAVHPRMPWRHRRPREGDRPFRRRRTDRESASSRAATDRASAIAMPMSREDEIDGP